MAPITRLLDLQWHDLASQRLHRLFLFGHSNGHDQAAADTLRDELIRNFFGGKQPSMQSSLIADNTYLGPYQHKSKLKICEIQHVSFKPTDNGPFYPTPKQCQQQQLVLLCEGKNKTMEKEMKNNNLEETSHILIPVKYYMM